MAFKVGDRVVIVRSAQSQVHVGKVATIGAIDALREHEANHHWWAGHAPGETVYQLDIVSTLDPAQLVWASGDDIEPLPDDGHERGEWDELTRRLCKPEKAEA